jgi:hypothetical protein
MMRNPVAIQTRAHGHCRVRDDSDQRREFWRPFEQDWIGACERAQRPRKQRNRDKSERSCRHRQRNNSSEVMMQRAAFILHVADPVAMIGMPAGCGVILDIDDGGLTFEHVRVDAGIFATINATWKAQLNVENLFNKGYWASADANNNISPGQPRTFRLKVSARF